MDTPERHRPPREPPVAATGSGTGEGLERLRREGEDFLSAADSAIERALSNDSEGFLRHVRQTGGQ